MKTTHLIKLLISVFTITYTVSAADSLELKQVSGPKECPNPQILLNQSKKILVMGQSVTFDLPFKEVLRSSSQEDVCFYEYESSGKFESLEKEFSLLRIDKRSKCQDKSFDGTVKHQLKRDKKGKIVYSNTLSDVKGAVVEEFLCEYK